MKQAIQKLFGDINLTWPKLIIFSVIMGIWTALMAMLVPDGNSFHDIAVTAEWWVLPAVLIIVNCKRPLEAAFKTFVFFLISQPLVYLIQVPFSEMGWSLFGYYRYWFIATLLTFPGAFIGWFIKKDKWYSGLILSVMTYLLVFTGIGYIREFVETPPNHLISIIYCFGIIPVFIFFIFRDKIPRIITAIISILAIIIFVNVSSTEPFESYQNTILDERNIPLIGEPHISSWSGEGEGNVGIIKYDEEGKVKYTLKLTGYKGKNYEFTVTDDANEKEYHFSYHFDKGQQTVIVERKSDN